MIKHPKYPRGNIYLSGGMQHADDLGGAWREEISEVLKDMSYYPLDITHLDKAYLAEHGDLYHSLTPDDHLQFKANMRKHFIYTDLELIKADSDALIVFYDESARLGAGTISECQYAYLLDIPIFLVSYWEDWHNEVPGWLQGLTTKIFTDFESLLDYMNDLPEGILKRDIYGNHAAGDQYLCSLSGEPFQKSGLHFVSHVSPLYSKVSVELVRTTNEELKDRYQFFLEYLAKEAEEES